MALLREKIEHLSKVSGLDVEPCKFISWFNGLLQPIFFKMQYSP